MIKTKTVSAQTHISFADGPLLVCRTIGDTGKPALGLHTSPYPNVTVGSYVQKPAGPFEAVIEFRSPENVQAVIDELYALKNIFPKPAPEQFQNGINTAPKGYKEVPFGQVEAQAENAAKQETNPDPDAPRFDREYLCACPECTRTRQFSDEFQVHCAQWGIPLSVCAPGSSVYPQRVNRDMFIPPKGYKRFKRRNAAGQIYLSSGANCKSEAVTLAYIKKPEGRYHLAVAPYGWQVLSKLEAHTPECIAIDDNTNLQILPNHQFNGILQFVMPGVTFFKPRFVGNHRGEAVKAAQKEIAERLGLWFRRVYPEATLNAGDTVVWTKTGEEVTVSELNSIAPINALLGVDVMVFRDFKDAAGLTTAFLDGIACPLGLCKRHCFKPSYRGSSRSMALEVSEADSVTIHPDYWFIRYKKGRPYFGGRNIEISADPDLKDDRFARMLAFTEFLKDTGHIRREGPTPVFIGANTDGDSILWQTFKK